AADILDLGGAVAGVLEHVRSRAAELGAPQAIAHRIVHGGAQFHQPTVLNDDVLAQIESLNSLAPLHNPPAIEAVRLAVAAYADVPHVAIFDTAWHGTWPRRARGYALPAGLREGFWIRRFGFHGVSHAHVVGSVAARMHASPQELRIISCHLGNGASVAAVEYGRSVETSMGMTPLEGLVMGTRVGDIDPGVLLLLL